MNDHEMCEPYRWSDDTGRDRWQPQLGNERLWQDHITFRWSHHDLGNGRFSWPKMYRWKWRARRRALKELKRQRRLFRPAEEQTVHRDPEEVREEFLRLVGQDSDGRLRSWVKKVLT